MVDSPRTKPLATLFLTTIGGAGRRGKAVIGTLNGFMDAA